MLKGKNKRRQSQIKTENICTKIRQRKQEGQIVKADNLIKGPFQI